MGGQEYKPGLRLRYSRHIGYDMAHVRPSLELFFGEHAEWRVWPNDEYAPFTERGGRSTFRVMQLTVNPRFSVQRATERAQVATAVYSVGRFWQLRSSSES